MYGEIIKKKKNKIGLFVNVLGEDKVSYYGDSRGISKDVLVSLTVGDKVEFEGELSSTGNPTVCSLVVVEKAEKICLEFSEEEKEKVKKLILLFMSQEESCFITKLNQFLLSNGFDYRKYGFQKLKGFFIEQFADVLRFETKEYNGVPQTVLSLLDPGATSTLDTDTLMEKLSVLTAETGYYLASEMPNLIEQHCYVNYKLYAKTIADFVDIYLSSRFTFIREIKVDDKRIPNVVVPNEHVSDFGTIDNVRELTQEIVESMKIRIQEIIDVNGVFLCSLFPSFIREFGINDYRDYASSVDSFVEKFLSDRFTVKRNVRVGDKYYPNVIVPITTVDAKYTEQEEHVLGDLVEFYNNYNWEGFLTSPSFAQADTTALSIETIQMGLSCARKILDQNSEAEVKLSLFQKELITNATARDFIKKWKKGSEFSDVILQSFTETSMCNLSFDDDKKLISKILNDLGRDTKPNTTFTSLISRFEAIKDKIIPYLYVIRLYGSRSTKAIEQCVAEYCYFIKNLNDFSTHKVQRRVFFEEQVINFKSFIKFAHLRMEGQPFSRSLRANLVSVFFDIKQSCNIRDLLKTIDEGETYPEWKLVHFLESNSWEEEQIKNLFVDVNLRLVAKSVSVVWERYIKENALPKEFLSVLAWIIKYGNHKILDEIIRIHYLSEYTKREKQLSLIGSLQSLVELLGSVDWTYNFICYIVSFVFPDFLESAYPQICEFNDHWENISNDYYDAHIKQCTPLTADNEEDFVNLFSIFALDQDKVKELQNIYGDWYVNQNDWETRPSEQVIQELRNTHGRGAFRAFQLAYESGLRERSDLDDLHELYVDSLIKLGAYGKAIRSAFECEFLNQNTREKYVVKAIGDNFSKFGFSPSGLLIFDDNFSIQEAIDFLMRHFSTTDYSLILSLIVLYASNDELIKSVYLFSIFHARAEVGYSRIYAQFRSKYGRYFAKLHNHYSVIQAAFNGLSMPSLLSFIKWAGKITIPDYSDYFPTHVFSMFYDALLKDSDDINTWKKTFNHIIGKQERNAWLICVCGMIMMHKFGMPNSSLIHSSFVAVLEDVSNDKPRNLLDFLCQYIVENEDVALCSQLGQLLSDKNAKAQLLENNPWGKRNTDIIDTFTSFCLDKLQETGNMLYYDIITNIKEEISGKELLELSHFSMGKSFLIKKICQCYLENVRKDEVLVLLSEDLWQNSSYQEKEIYRVLKLVYESDMLLMANYSRYFSDEEDVQRFKQDCIKIISTYPDSAAFLQFNQECFNLKHKLLVFSFTLGIFYNEDIYKTYWLKYNTLIEQNIYDVYLRYLEKCYEAQLVYNPLYIFEYKTWRYLKLLMIECFKSENVDDTHILRLMKMNGHYERLMSEGYETFKQNIKEMLQIKDIDEEEKRQLLFGLISDDFSDFTDLKNSFLYKLSSESKCTLKRILAALNYRDVNQIFYQKYIPMINGDNDQDIVAMAETFSDTVALAFSEWFSTGLKEKEPELFADLTISAVASGKSKGNICVEKVLELEEELYNSNKTFINAVVASKQLPGKIFDRLRMSAIGRAKGNFNSRFEELAVYLQNNGYPMALSQYKYLIAIKYATENKRNELRSYLDNVGADFLDEVPADWRVDSSRIIEFAKSDSVEVIFKPNSSFYYSESYLVETKGFSFVNLVYQNYKGYRGKKDVQTIKPTIEEISNNKVDINDRISSALGYFHSVGINGENINLALALGFLMVSTESVSISANHKLAILIDLYNHRSYLTQIQKERIFECFLEIYREFSVDVWVDNQKEIVDILSLNASDSDLEEVQDLIKHILEDCPEFKEPSLSRATELQLEQLKKIAFIGSSSYVSAIKAAVSRRIKQIEGNARITSCIENVDGLLQDGCIYFQFKNNGYITVDLQENCDILLTATLPNNQVSKYNVQVSDIRELRAGWITGCVQDISNLCKGCNVGDCIEIKIEVRINEKLVTRTLSTLKVAESVLLASRPRPGYHVKYAAGENEKNRLYGREEEQEDIAYAIESGKAVIYGPSRIGKTSLLNWVRHNLASERGNVITVLFGGEGGKGKESDYIEYFYDNNHRKIQYDNKNRTEINSSLSEYLLIDTLKYGLTDKRFGRANFDAEIMKNQDLLNQISSILNQDEPIEYRYRQIDSVLKAYDSELWILFDEFQQVVERWNNINDDEPIDFIRLCESVNEIDISSIKLIFCGSDELLRQMVLIRDNSVWRKKILNTAGQVRIGPIKEPASNIPDPFKKMITEDDSVVKPGIVYSEEALTAICVYSARVPMYGKEICNTVLENVSSLGAEKFGRNVIYSYDIAKATQMLATQMLDDIRKGDTTTGRRNEFNTSRIVQIFDAVTKGLDDDTDKQYLWFIANWFINNPSKDRFPYSEFAESTTKRLMYGEDALIDSLTIAKERGIISGDERRGFIFSTVFYHNAFCGTVNNLDENKIFVHTDDNISSRGSDHQLDKFDSFVDQMTLDEKKEKHFSLYRMIHAADSSYPDELRELIGGNTNVSGDIVHGDKKMQMNLQVTAQTINSFSTLLSGDCSSTEFAKAFANIPSIRTYLGDGHKKVLALQDDIGAFLDEDGEIVYDTIEEYESRSQLVERKFEEIEQIVGPAMDRRVKDISSVVTIDDFVSANEELWVELLKVDSETVKKLKELPTQYSSALGFAVIIHNVFDKIYNNSVANGEVNADELDFCPVAILYCKIIEAMLKEEHTALYASCFGNRPVDSRKPNSPLFEEIDKNNSSLTIGTYVHFLSTVNINRISTPNAYNKLRHVQFVKDAEITDLSRFTSKSKSVWFDHACQLPIIVSTRNKSAHEIQPIKKDRFDWLIDVLFKQGELMRIWELAQESETN